MTEHIWLIVANATAGFYAASLWGFFAWIRFRAGQWLWAVVDVAACAATGAVGVAYLQAAITHANPPVWLRWAVIPVLVLPVSLHLASWMRARRFIADTHPGGHE